MNGQSRIAFPILLLLMSAAFLGGVTFERSRGTVEDQRQISSQGVSTGLPKGVSSALVREVWDLLHTKYAGDVDDERLARGILRGLVDGLGDPYSAYADPKETSQFEDDLSGSFTGIGIEIGVRRGLITVITPLKDSPAEKSGIRPQDIIVSVDGKELHADALLTDIVSKIRGPAGTTVTLGIVREEDPSGEKKFVVRRERIQVSSVSSRREGTIGILEVSAFHEDTAQRVRRAVRDLISAGVTGVVLDLRNNPGGILDSAVDIASHFVKPGSIVVKEVPARTEDTVEHHANGPADLLQTPIVVLVNEGSASASEILAGALRDLRGVRLIGTQTFGKGTVQQLIDLSDGSSIRITIAKWLTPSGHELTEEGLTPDIEIKDPNLEDEEDVVLKRAIEELSSLKSSAFFHGMYKQLLFGV